MDGELSSLFNIRTDRIVGVNPKSRERQGNRQQFAPHLDRDDEDDSERPAGRDPDAHPTEAEEENRAPPPPRRPSDPNRGKVIDYEV